MWLNEYSRITSLCRSEKMVEMEGTRPQWALIQDIEAQGDDWSSQHFTLMIHRTPTFSGEQKVDFHEFFVSSYLKCLPGLVFQCLCFDAGVVAGALAHCS
jgi:hypothetical protein